jgi:hypothetical protein
MTAAEILPIEDNPDSAELTSASTIDAAFEPVKDLNEQFLAAVDRQPCDLTVEAAGEPAAMRAHVAGRESLLNRG